LTNEEEKKNMTTNYQAAKLYQFLDSDVANSLSLNLPGSVAVAKNKFALKPVYESLIDAEKRYKTPSERYIAFEKLRQALVLECAVRDESGNPIIEGDRTRLIDPLTFQTKYNDLVSEYLQDIEEFQSKISQWEKFLMEEADVKIIKIQEKDVSYESMKKADVDAFLVMLDLGLEVVETKTEEVVAEPKEKKSKKSK
jgi:hypothetical protein